MDFFVGRNMWTDALILNHHYSHRLPAGVCLVVSARVKNKPVATCYFTSLSMGHWSESVIELIRLVKKDGIKLNLTQLISYGMKHLKKKHNLVISYADFSQHHHGGIYQACSWNFHDKRNKRLEGYVVDGDYIPTRNYNQTLIKKYGTCSLNTIKDNPNIKPVYGEGKFLYWKALNKQGIQKAKRLGLQSNPYPKPGKIKTDRLIYTQEPKRKENKNLQKLF